MINSLASSVGRYLALYVMDRLPCLSCSPCTNNVIQVTWGDAVELNRLKDIFLDHNSPTRDEDFKVFVAFLRSLRGKYLPHEFSMSVPHFDVSDPIVVKKIKEVFIEEMWDWDHCEWSLKDCDIELKGCGDFTEIKMKLDF